ncbi:hypothetical protein ACFWA6_06750 [Streptomyces sp. NPDC060020]|uniref:hypothetical protein n=1 Tax=Streptomyces sp. NPDC060020 TaxID=3347038 RepID=UPI0036D04F3A
MVSALHDPERPVAANRICDRVYDEADARRALPAQTEPLNPAVRDRHGARSALRPPMRWPNRRTGRSE